MKAYIIEDDIGLAISYEMLVQECGISDISVFNNFNSALRKLESESSDIMVLNLSLIEEDDITNLKSNGCDVILTSDKSNISQVDLAMKIGAAGLFIRPFDFNALKFQIKSLEKRRKQIEQESFCFVKSRNNYIRIPYKDISMLETEGNYTSIFTTNGKYVLKRSLKNVSNDLPKDIFTRVHRNFVINHKMIKHLDLKKNQIQLTDDKLVQIGGKYRNIIKETIGTKFKVV